ncbi:hypothetical protein C7974DRAFT_384610 [Boeremia exigua]|uniref:uncharacterized protein n=1 Tax=Boeremia exigua TaxID=749465 RepID=UPI001E8EB9BF|nr:uncharacterized protein C7974DRAFT_384610 [Boeremia exigua]KAH6641973.1 hypothetical protein C7974DRAFT_384610 [Boeremia exigua]
MSSKSYDFIVVGSGPAGACVASRLASHKSHPAVLLIEAGIARDVSNANILAERWSAASQFPNSVEKHTTEAQTWLDNRSIDYSRGKVLGGSSAINMCAYTVGPKDDYDRWARIMDDASFGWENAVRIRKEKIETYHGEREEEFRGYTPLDTSMYGTQGVLSVSLPRVWETSMVAQLDAAEASGLGFSRDINSGNPLGMASVPSTAKNGLRVTAAKAYLEDAPENLVILTETQVVKILMEGKRAVGVQVAGGEEHHASKEVILSAGAVETPKLLMLSGIGDATELAEHGIESSHHLPGVGKCLQDHLCAAFCWKQKTASLTWAQHFSDPDTVKQAHAEFREHGTGPLSVFFQGLTMGFFKADEVLHTPEFSSLDAAVKEHLRKPTVPIWELSSHIPPCTPAALAAPQHEYLTCFVFLHNPQSRGQVTLRSASPTTPPRIDPRFFSHPFDRVCAVAATKRALAFVRHASMAAGIDVAVDAPASERDEDVLAYWRARAASTWHPACTVRMGGDEDEGACVGRDFRVRGLQGLRVVDLSVLPFLLNCHPVSVAYLVGEIAAEKIIAEYYT